MATRHSDEVRTEWVCAWATISAIAQNEWLQLNRECVTVAANSLNGVIPRLISKAWISGKQGHKK